jgi:hypothetical protein
MLMHIHSMLEWDLSRTMPLDDLGQIINLKLVDKQGKELVELKLQVLA